MGWKIHDRLPKIYWTIVGYVLGSRLLGGATLYHYQRIISVLRNMSRLDHVLRRIISFGRPCNYLIFVYNKVHLYIGLVPMSYGLYTLCFLFLY